MSLLARERLIVFLASGGGVGYSPYFPGTLGTLVAIPIALFFNRLAVDYPLVALTSLAGLILFAIWLSDQAAKILSAKDPQIIVIDEVAGFTVAAFLTGTLTGLIAAFVLFRFFDIAKVFPASRLESLPGGAGIVLDDIMAGFYTLVILHILSRMSLI
jgi:phosphatidylglycerophosphatase A